MIPKPWYQSRTVWINVIVSVLVSLAFVLEGMTAGDLQTPVEVNPELAVLLLGVLNVILRFVTSKPIVMKLAIC